MPGPLFMSARPSPGVGARAVREPPLQGGCVFEVVAFYGGLAELVLLDLAARGHRVLLDEVDVFGDFEVCDALAAVVLDVLRGNVGALA